MHAVILTAELTSTVHDEQVAATIHASLTEARTFDGCLGVETLVDVEDASRVTVIARWVTTEANDAYLRWRRADGAAGALAFGALLARPPYTTKATPAPGL